MLETVQEKLNAGWTAGVPSLLILDTYPAQYETLHTCGVGDGIALILETVQEKLNSGRTAVVPAIVFL